MTKRTMNKIFECNNYIFFQVHLKLSFCKHKTFFLEDLDVCYSSPCQNSGSCHNTGAGQFRCFCPSLFRGITCEGKLILHNTLMRRTQGNTIPIFKGKEQF